MLAKISIGIITHQRRTDLKQMRWQKELQSGRSDGCGGATQWNAIGTCETYRNSLDQWTTPQVKKRFDVPCNGPIKSFGATISHRPISQKDKQRLDQFGNSAPGRFMGYALPAGEWSGDLLIADSDDLEKKHRLRSRRPERFKSQEVQVTTAHGNTSCHVMMDLLSKKDTSSLDLSVTDNFKKKTMMREASLTLTTNQPPPSPS